VKCRVQRLPRESVIEFSRPLEEKGYIMTIKKLTAGDIVAVVRATLGMTGKEFDIIHDNGYGINITIDGNDIVIITITDRVMRMTFALFYDFICDFFREVTAGTTEETVLKYREWSLREVEGN
jgi:hypothetical protein